MLRPFPWLLALVLLSTGCEAFVRPRLSESDAQLRVRRALRDVESAGFPLPGEFGLTWSDRSVRCSPGYVCVSPRLSGRAEGSLVIAPEVLESSARLRLALLEVWQRLTDGGSMLGPRAFARSTLRQLVSGPLVGVSDPLIMDDVLRAYTDYRNAIPEDERVGLPDPEAYSRRLGFFLVPLSLPEPDTLPTSSFAPRALGEFPKGDCAEANKYIHTGMPGWEGRQLFWQGVCAAEAGDLPSAIEFLLRAERLLPHDSRVPLELGEVICRSGHRKAAVLAFERAARRSPDGTEQADAYRGIGRCSLEAGDLEAAQAAYREAVALDPEDVVTEDWLRWLEQ